MNLYLVRAETDDGVNLDLHVIANTAEEAVEVWKSEDPVDGADIPDGFIVHLVIEFDPEIEPTCTGRPYALDWSVGEHFPIG
jgi:hypothetical protein